MKSKVISRISVIDAIATGLNEAGRRPLLWTIPILVDLFLWFAPKLSVATLSEQLLAESKKLLPQVYAADQMARTQEAFDVLQKGVVELGKAINLGGALASGWLAPPSALTSVQPTRSLLISDAVLAPISLGIQVKPLDPSSWQGNAIQIGSVLGVFAVVALLWIVSHLLTALYFRMVARSLPVQPQLVAAQDALPASQPAQESRGSIFDGWLPLAARFMVLSLFASFVAFLLRMPLILITSLAVVSGSGALQFLYMLSGGITLWLTTWFLSALYFVGDALAFEHQPLSAGLMQSLILVRSNGLKVLILVTVVNLLMLGGRAVWGLIGSSPVGAMVAIVVNGYLSTAMVVGIYVYYQDIRRHWQIVQASRVVSK